MDVAFPYPVKVRASVPSLTGMRFNPFTNIDGETFAAPALNGFWKLEMSLIAIDMRAQLAMSAFVTQMEAAGATCVVPVAVQWRPNDDRGRMIKPNAAAPEYTFDHVGWDGVPFDGFTLRAAVAHRDSYVDIDKPALSQLWPGHYITLDDRLYQVVKVSAIAESETAIRVSVMPNIRGAHASGKVVVVDQLALKCKMEQGDQIGASYEPVRFGSISFFEAF
jgi:hypothetical protein